MDARCENSTAERYGGEHEEKPVSTHVSPPVGRLAQELHRRIAASIGSNLLGSMDPNDSTHGRPHAWDHPAPSSAAESRRRMQAGDFTWIQQLHDEQAARFKAELWRRLQLMPAGQRIRNLRSILGWTQRMAAAQLGISVRTVIRHEQGHHRTPWPRLSLLLRLRELESIYAGPIIAHRRHGSGHA